VLALALTQAVAWPRSLVSHDPFNPCYSTFQLYVPSFLSSTTSLLLKCHDGFKIQNVAWLQSIATSEPSILQSVAIKGRKSTEYVQYLSTYCKASLQRTFQSKPCGHPRSFSRMMSPNTAGKRFSVGDRADACVPCSLAREMIP
jgi:hypothetical protein